MKIFYTLFIVLAFNSCKNTQPKSTTSELIESKIIADTVSELLFTRPITSKKAESKPRPNIFKRILPGKTKVVRAKYKNVTFIHQVAGGNIEAVNTAKVKEKPVTKTKPVTKSTEKLKAQNAIKGNGNKATADKSDKALMWVVIALVVVAGGYIYLRSRKV